MEESCRTFLFIWCVGSMRSLCARIARGGFASDGIVLKQCVTLLVSAERVFVLSADILGFLATRYPRIWVTGKCSHIFCNYSSSEFSVTNFFFPSRRPT